MCGKKYHYYKSLGDSFWKRGGIFRNEKKRSKLLSQRLTKKKKCCSIPMGAQWGKLHKRIFFCFGKKKKGRMFLQIEVSVYDCV